MFGTGNIRSLFWGVKLGNGVENGRKSYGAGRALLNIIKDYHVPLNNNLEK